jgi:hypothetical protein
LKRRDLADPATRAAQLAFMVPFFVLMAVLYGALNAALDTTAGERERGSLEPLLMNPAASHMALVLGKWGAVASVGMLIAVLSCLSFLPGQWLLRSEALAAMFRFGIGEALAFIALLLPLAGALAAVLMAIAIRCKSFKEAQANATVVVLVVSMLPLVLVLNQEGTAPWHLWVPALAQTTLMGRVLRVRPARGPKHCPAGRVRGAGRAGDRLRRAHAAQRGAEVAPPAAPLTGSQFRPAVLVHTRLSARCTSCCQGRARTISLRKRAASCAVSTSPSSADQAQVGHHRHRVGHGHHAARHLHPVPGHAGFAAPSDFAAHTVWPAASRGVARTRVIRVPRW